MTAKDLHSKSPATKARHIFHSALKLSTMSSSNNNNNNNNNHNHNHSNNDSNNTDSTNNTHPNIHNTYLRNNTHHNTIDQHAIIPDNQKQQKHHTNQINQRHHLDQDRFPKQNYIDTHSDREIKNYDTTISPIITATTTTTTADTIATTSSAHSNTNMNSRLDVNSGQSSNFGQPYRPVSPYNSVSSSSTGKSSNTGSSSNTRLSSNTGSSSLSTGSPPNFGQPFNSGKPPQLPMPRISLAFSVPTDLPTTSNSSPVLTSPTSPLSPTFISAIPLSPMQPPPLSYQQLQHNQQQQQQQNQLQFQSQQQHPPHTQSQSQQQQSFDMYYHEKRDTHVPSMSPSLNSSNNSTAYPNTFNANSISNFGSNPNSNINTNNNSNYTINNTSNNNINNNNPNPVTVRPYPSTALSMAAVSARSSSNSGAFSYYSYHSGSSNRDSGGSSLMTTGTVTSATATANSGQSNVTPSVYGSGISTSNNNVNSNSISGSGKGISTLHKARSTPAFGTPRIEQDEPMPPLPLFLETSSPTIPGALISNSGSNSSLTGDTSYQDISRSNTTAAAGNVSGATGIVTTGVTARASPTGATVSGRNHNHHNSSSHHQNSHYHHHNHDSYHQQLPPPRFYESEPDALSLSDSSRDLADDIISSYAMSSVSMDQDSGLNPVLSVSSSNFNTEQPKVQQAKSQQSQSQSQQAQQVQSQDQNPDIIKPLISNSQPTFENPTTSPNTNTDPSRDRYGFKKKTSFLTEAQYDAWWKEYQVHLARRKKKWIRLMRDNGLNTGEERGIHDNSMSATPPPPPQRFPPKSEKLKRYIRKGIPAEWRGNAWFYYAKGSEKLHSNKGVYEKLCVQTVGLKNSDTDIIERDLYRTFPDNVHFRSDIQAAGQVPTGQPAGQQGLSGQSNQPGQPGQSPQSSSEPALISALRRLLVSFSVYQPKIGYCQSLNFLAGLLLLFMDEEKAFWMLVIITQRYLPGVHDVNLEGVNVDQGVLMLCTKEALPKLWHKIGINFDGTHDSNMLSKLPPITLCTAAWFMSGYIGILPIETVLRVWDCFFLEDSKTFFRIALTIFKLAEPEIEKADDPMEVFQVVQTFPKKLIDPAVLMSTCFKRRNGIGHISQDEITKMRDFVRLRRQQANLAALKLQQRAYATNNFNNNSNNNNINSNANGNNKTRNGSVGDEDVARKRASTMSAATAPLLSRPETSDSFQSKPPPLGVPFANNNNNNNNHNRPSSSANTFSSSGNNTNNTTNNAINNSNTSNNTNTTNTSNPNKSSASAAAKTNNTAPSSTKKKKRISGLKPRDKSQQTSSNSSHQNAPSSNSSSQSQNQNNQNQQISQNGNDLDDYLHFKHPHGLHSNFTRRMKSLKLAPQKGKK